MIVVHHLNESRSQRVLWLLEELGLPYEIRHYARDAKTRLAPQELQAVHPLGKSPVVEADGLTLVDQWPSLADPVDLRGAVPSRRGLHHNLLRRSCV